MLSAPALRLLSVGVAAGIAAACASASRSHQVGAPRLSAPPASLEPGMSWRARLTASSVARRVVVTAREGPRTLRFSAVRTKPGSYAVALSFPHTGSWRLAAVVGRRRHALRRVRVTLPIVEAYRVVVDRDGTLLVADANHGRGRVARIDPATGQRSVAARFSGRVYSVTVGPDGRAYVVAADKVVRLGPGGRRTIVAGNGSSETSGDGGPATAAGLGDAFAVAFAPGRLYVSQQTSPGIRAVDLGTGRIRTFASGFEQPLGLATLPGGTLLVADSHHGRVAAVTPDGSTSTFQGGLQLPVDVSLGRDGSVLVVDHVAHDAPSRIVRRAPGGAVTVVSEGRAVALTSVAETPDGTLYATSFGRYKIGVVDPATGQLRPLPGR